jgi:predicted nucleotidyltransferase
MLHFNTVHTQTLELLIKLQSINEFSNLRLVGGTALALQIGHRISIDIDLFGQLNVDDIFFYQNLKEIGSMVHLKKSQNINIFTINNIKVDIVNYPYQWLCEAIKSKLITMADKPDIAAMKLAAITGRGTKKDFIDLYFLLQYFTLSEMLTFYKQKYPDGSEFLVLRSLSYFSDADENELPNMLEPLDWQHVKKTLKNEIIKIS